MLENSATRSPLRGASVGPRARLLDVEWEEEGGATCLGGWPKGDEGR